VKGALHGVPNAFEALLQLLQSDYPVIQHQALVALGHAAGNGRFCYCVISFSLIRAVGSSLLTSMCLCWCCTLSN